MKLYVIADDLTGANATAVLLAKSGLKCSSFIDSNLLTDKVLDLFEVVAVTTDSRGLTKKDAYEKVSKEVKRVKKHEKIITKRIDSTLRGNIGAEIDAVLDNVSDGVAIIVAAYPDSKRVTLGGFLLVESVLLEKTAVANDPKCPIYQSRVKDIIKNQSKHEIICINIDEVIKGVDSLKNTLEKAITDGFRIIVVDSLTNEDIQVVASAASKLQKNIIAVDPGPFTKFYISAKNKEIKIEKSKKVFFSIGSVSKNTINQINFLTNDDSVKIVKINSSNLFDKETRFDEINSVSLVLKNEIEFGNYSSVGVVTVTNDSDVLDLKSIAESKKTSVEELTVLINTGIAEITERVIDSSNGVIGALYTSGGDVTIELMKLLEVRGIDVKDEITPLAVYGRFIGGKYPNMPIVTKGGLIGDEKTLKECIEYLSTKISTEHYKID